MSRPSLAYGNFALRRERQLRPLASTRAARDESWELVRTAGIKFNLN
jgi:hypothetical protein